jgi:predicted DNA-binding transcriptional regulator AlpA
MEKESAEKEIIGIREAAKYLNCSYLTVYRMLAANEFPSPAEERVLDFPRGRKIVRVWKPSQLDVIRGKLRKRGQRKNLP